MLLTERSLNQHERGQVLEFCHQFSGRRALTEPGRPLEVQSLVCADHRPAQYPPISDFLYGEWLRDDLTRQQPPARAARPDVAVVLTAARSDAQALRGPALSALVDPVPTTFLHRSILDSVPELMSDLAGDERNVLLTLARMVITLRTDAIASKDDAARQVASELPETHGLVLLRAAAGYRGELFEDWSDHADQVASTAQHLARWITSPPTRAPER